MPSILLLQPRVQYVSLCLAIASLNLRFKRKLLNLVTYFPLPSRFRLSLPSIAFQSTSIYGLLLCMSYFNFIFSEYPSMSLQQGNIYVQAAKLLVVLTKRRSYIEEITGAAQNCFYLTLAGLMKDFLKQYFFFLLKLIFFSQQIKDVNFESIVFVQSLV